MKNKKILIIVLALIGILGGTVGYDAFSSSAAKFVCEFGAIRCKVQSGGELDIESGGELDIESGGALKLAGTAITSSATELNLLDGVTSVASELTLIDGLTATAAELNILDGVTSNYTELNLLDGVSSVASEMTFIDGITATSAELSDAYAYASIADISGTNSAAVVSPVSGTIGSIKYVLGGTPSALCAITASINGTNITDGAVNLESEAAEYTVYSATPSANNTVDVGSLIVIESDGGAAGATSVHATFIIDL